MSPLYKGSNREISLTGTSKRKGVFPLGSSSESDPVHPKSSQQNGTHFNKNANKGRGVGHSASETG
jgi:hypothetical protein